MRNFLLILTFISLLNCGQNDKVANYEVDAKMPNVAPSTNSISDKIIEQPTENSPVQKDSISKKIIKNGSIEIQVGDISKAKNKVNESLKKFKGYIQTENFVNTDERDNLNFTIRVPYQNFEPLINSFSNDLGSLVSKQIFSDDVTEEYSDVSIKLANKKIYLEKYRDLLKGATSTKDIMEIQEKIRGLEDEIDVSEGRLKFIDDRVNLSTLQLSLFNEKSRDTITSRIGFGSRFTDSLAAGWNNFIGFFLGLISFWPFLFIIPFFIYLWRKWRKRKK